jgi:hypothetical protein
MGIKDGDTRPYHQDGAVPDRSAGYIWVFGSNLAGSHGGGAARVASDAFGAVHGVGVGRTGFSYAIPTINRYGDPLTVTQIGEFVTIFLAYAKIHAELKFWVTRVGCGIAGNDDRVIAPFFAQAPQNCDLPDAWRHLLAPR